MVLLIELETLDSHFIQDVDQPVVHLPVSSDELSLDDCAARPSV